MNLTFMTFLVLTSLKGYSLDSSEGRNSEFSSNSAHFTSHFDVQNLNALQCEEVDVEEEEALDKKVNSKACFQYFLSQICLCDQFSAQENTTNFEQPFVADSYYIKYCSLKIPSL